MSEQTQDEAASQWRVSMQRVCALVEDLDAEQLERHVPACPDWTVRDLLSHMVGLGADVVAGDEPDDHNDAWTRAQVEHRRGRSAAALLEEWRGLADDLVGWMREHGSRPLNDVVIHEQDLRGAVGRLGGAETRAFALVRDRMVGRFASAVEGRPPIALVAPGWAWCSSGPVEDAAVVLRAPERDLARALMSRRTAAQVTSWVERGDVSAYLDAFAGLGDLPDVPLPECSGPHGEAPRHVRWVGRPQPTFWRELRATRRSASRVEGRADLPRRILTNRGVRAKTAPPLV